MGTWVGKHVVSHARLHLDPSGHCLVALFLTFSFLVAVLLFSCSLSLSLPPSLSPSLSLSLSLCVCVCVCLCVCVWENLCTARALHATFRLCSPRRAPKQTPWKHP